MPIRNRSFFTCFLFCVSFGFVFCFGKFCPNNLGVFTVYTDVGYSRLNQGNSSRIRSRKEGPESTVKGLKYGLWFLPRTVRQTHNFLQEATTDGISGKSRGEKSLFNHKLSLRDPYKLRLHKICFFSLPY